MAPLITKKVTNFRDPISASERLTVTLRYLATGESFRSLQYVFRIPHNTISGIIPEVCDALYKVLQPNYLKVEENIALFIDLKHIVSLDSINQRRMGNYFKRVPANVEFSQLHWRSRWKTCCYDCANSLWKCFL